MQSCVVFMPRIDLWAIETQVQISTNTDSCSTNRRSPEMANSCSKPSQVTEKEKMFNVEKDKSGDLAQDKASGRASYAWMSFIEQVESIGVSTSLIILVWMLILPVIDSLCITSLLIFSYIIYKRRKPLSRDKEFRG